MNHCSGTNSPLGESRRHVTAGYLMIDHLEIENFRGIERVSLSNLGRLNVLVGPNGSGKTAFLEAIYMAGGNNAENLLRTKANRGREMGEIQGDVSMVQHALWSDTFRSPELGRALIKLVDVRGVERSLLIEKIDSTRVYDPVAGANVPTNAGMQFTWLGPDGPIPILPLIVPGGLSFPAAPPGPGIHFVGARTNISESETARTFSRLAVDGEERPFVEAFEREFRWLSDITVQAPSGGPALYAKMQNGRTLPLTMISGGISHLAAILVRIAAHKESVILVDEIENGFYYDKYESIWRTMFDLATRSNAQLFVTTHSAECLRALSTALKDNAGDVRFIRSKRSDTGEVEFHQMSGEGLFKALNVGEVR